MLKRILLIIQILLLVASSLLLWLVVSQPCETDAKPTQVKEVVWDVGYVTTLEEPEDESEVRVVNKPIPTITPEQSNNQTFRVSAYCPCVKCCGKSDGVTATGVKATANRTIAVDPKVIPYGTTIILNGQEYIAEDCGGAIKGNKLDIYFDTHEEAVAFGVQHLEGEIVR